ncbi:hypothetical protein AA13594_0736 [Gluconacetobacter azotocaptans DSM 13594]|nr:hypothetical protein AA13594_0736 [Gluconacetobacter azotocaptans DSM 13594]
MRAVRQYGQALAMRPGWTDAIANPALALALARAENLSRLQGKQTGQERVVPDERYRRDQDRDDHPAPDDAAVPAMADEAIRALWLRRVQTRRADFLRPIRLPA